MEYNLIWLVKLLLAHLLSDFLFQGSSWITDRNTNKAKSKFLYLHIGITALTALLMIGYEYWAVLLVVTITHYCIDLGKSYLPDKFLYFALDQFAHVAVILGCWLLQFRLIPDMEALSHLYHESNIWIVAIGAFFLTYPSAIIIAKATKKWSDQIPLAAPNSTSTASNTITPSAAAPQISTIPAAGTGLIRAGKYIGIIERLLICVLVYHEQYEAVGLLITAKSILRYNSANEEIKTEYLLVGTLISISIAFAVGFALKLLIKI